MVVVELEWRRDKVHVRAKQGIYPVARANILKSYLVHGTTLGERLGRQCLRSLNIERYYRTNAAEE